MNKAIFFILLLIGGIGPAHAILTGSLDREVKARQYTTEQISGTWVCEQDSTMPINNSTMLNIWAQASPGSYPIISLDFRSFTEPFISIARKASQSTDETYSSTGALTFFDGTRVTLPIFIINHTQEAYLGSIGSVYIYITYKGKQPPVSSESRLTPEELYGLLSKERLKSIQIDGQTINLRDMDSYVNLMVEYMIKELEQRTGYHFLPSD